MCPCLVRAAAAPRPAAGCCCSCDDRRVAGLPGVGCPTDRDVKTLSSRRDRRDGRDRSARLARLRSHGGHSTVIGYWPSLKQLVVAGVKEEVGRSSRGPSFSRFSAVTGLNQAGSCWLRVRRGMTPGVADASSPAPRDDRGRVTDAGRDAAGRLEQG